MSCLQNAEVTLQSQSVWHQTRTLPFSQDVLDFLKSYFIGACQRKPQAIKLYKINSATAIHIRLRTGVMNIFLVLPVTSEKLGCMLEPALQEIPP